MRRGRAIVLVATMACRESPGDAAGVAVVRVPDEVSCGRCAIEARTVATLEVPPDTSDGYPFFVRVDSQRRYWVIRQDGDLPVLFDSSGRFLQVVGRHGRGPGEFEGVVNILVAGRDSILVLDRSRRGIWLDSTVTPQGDIRLPLAPHVPVVVSWPGTVVGSGAIPFQESRGPLYHLSFASPQPTVIRQFQLADVGENPELTFYTWHHFSSPRRGRVWAMWSQRYDLGEFDESLTRTRLLERRPDWFPGTAPVNYDWKNEPPPPQTGGIEQDEDGLLWAYSRVGAPTWKEAWPVVPEGVHEAPARLIQRELLYHTVLEVIDPRRGRVVSRLKINWYLLNPLHGRLAAFYEEGNLGGRIRIVALDLVRP
ncbi:MAG TPA: hypothetical protein VF981_00690 [Gemmatimonadaceae bacterium]